LIPTSIPVMLASSSPIRDWLTYSGQGAFLRRCFGFRGASGIDGTLSMGMGLSIIMGRMILVTGDLALLHDTNGWLFSKDRNISLIVVMIDNGGGGIFNQLNIDKIHEGDFESRRVLLYTLRFTAKTYLFGPVSDASKDIITRSTVNYLTGTDTSNAQRNLTYSVVPRALKDYDNSIVTNLAEDITATQTVIAVNDVTNITASSGSTSVYLDIDGEEVYVKSKDADSNKITVKRGQDKTAKKAHIRGTDVKSITSADNAFIEEGDNFGFDGTTTWNG